VHRLYQAQVLPRSLFPDRKGAYAVVSYPKGLDRFFPHRIERHPDWLWDEDTYKELETVAPAPRALAERKPQKPAKCRVAYGKVREQYRVAWFRDYPAAQEAYIKACRADGARVTELTIADVKGGDD